MSNDIITEGYALRLASEARDRYASKLNIAKNLIIELLKSGDLDRDDQRVQRLVNELEIELTKSYSVSIRVTHIATAVIPFDADIYDYEFNVSGAEIECNDGSVEMNWSDMDDIDTPYFEEQ